MADKDDLIERALGVLEQDGMPTKQQKDIMLNRILTECKAEKCSGLTRLREVIFSYPWRFAFIVSAVQAVVFTLIFGTQYTNLFLGLFGG